MRYKDYIARVEFDDEAGLFHGEIINTRDVITFQGESVVALRQAFEESVNDYLAFCAERGEKPDKPFSGKFVVRVSDEIHRLIFMAANMEGKSLNAWVADALNRAAIAVGTTGDEKPRNASLDSLATQMEQINLHLSAISTVLQRSQALPMSSATVSIMPGVLGPILAPGSHSFHSMITHLIKGYGQHYLSLGEMQKVSTETSFQEKHPIKLN